MHGAKKNRKNAHYKRLINIKSAIQPPVNNSGTWSDDWQKKSGPRTRERLARENN